jgi:hypothetical protein
MAKELSFIFSLHSFLQTYIKGFLLLGKFLKHIEENLAIGESPIMDIAGELLTAKAIVHLMLYGTGKNRARKPHHLLELLLPCRGCLVCPRHTARAHSPFIELAYLTSYATCCYPHLSASLFILLA